MDQPVRTHIERIQRQIDELRASLPGKSHASERMEVESHIRSLRLALAHFELGLQIEAEVSMAQSRAER